MLFCARSRSAKKGQSRCFPSPCSWDKQISVAFPWMYCHLLTLPYTSPAPFAETWEETLGQPASAFLQAFSTFPTSPPQLEEAKLYKKIAVLPIHRSGPSSHKPEPLKSFSLLLGLFPHVIFFFRDTSKPNRNNLN